MVISIFLQTWWTVELNLCWTRSIPLHNAFCMCPEIFSWISVCCIVTCDAFGLSMVTLCQPQWSWLLRPRVGIMPIKQHLSCSLFLLRLAFLSNELSPSQCRHTIIIVLLLMAQVHRVEVNFCRRTFGNNAHPVCIFP